MKTESRSWDLAFVVLLFSAAFLFRIWGLTKLHFWDEAVYLQNAEVICCGKLNYSELNSRPPLLSLIFAAVFKVWHSIYAADIVTAAINGLGPVVLYLSGRRVVGRTGAGIAALLLGFAPFFVGVFPEDFDSDNTGNSLLTDEPAVTVLLLGFWLLLAALRRQTFLRFFAVGVMFALCVLMRFSCLSTVAIIGLLLFGAQRWFRAALACLAGFTAGMLPYLCWSRWRYGGFLTTLRMGWELYQGGRQSVLYYAQNFGVIFGWITLAGVGLWLARWAWHKWRRLPQPLADGRDESLPKWIDSYLWAWALLVIALFFLMPHQEPRYIMPVAPALFLLAGGGLSYVLTFRRRAWQVGGGLVLAIALLVTFWPDRERLEGPFVNRSVSQEMVVAKYLDENLPPGTTLYCNFNYPVFGFYSHLAIYELRERGPRLYKALERLPVDGVLVAYKDPRIDPDPRPEWLAAHPQFAVFKEFESIVLYRYHRQKFNRLLGRP